MIKRGLRRWGQLLPPKCPDCGQPQQRFWRAHPFPMPSGYGRGTWLRQDCQCVRKEQEGRRAAVQPFLSPHWADPLPPALRQCCFESFKVGPYNEEGYQVCRKFADKFPSIQAGEGLFLYGSSGVGKTHLAAAMINQLKDNHWTAFAHVPALLDQLRRQIATIDTYTGAALLVLDDLGSERVTDWGWEQLLIILDNRLNNGRSTIITANYDTSQWEALDRIVGMRLASRIQGQHMPILIQGPDWRQQRYGAKR